MIGRSRGSAKPLVFVWLFFLVFFPLMISLGFWQLERGEEKRVLLLEQQNQSQKVAKVYVPGESAQRFEPQVLAGIYENKHLLLDNRQHQGEVGYELLSLFRTEDSRYFLVNRGWLAAPRYRSQIPVIRPPQSNGFSEVPELIELDSGSRHSVKGYFYWPDKDLTVLGSDAESGMEKVGPNIWRVQTLVWPLIAQRFGLEFDYPREFRLASEDELGAENIYWSYAMMKPEKHDAYAFQWFSMAFALLVLAIFASFKLWPKDVIRTENN